MPEKLKSPKGKKAKTKIKTGDLAAGGEQAKKDKKKKKKDEEKKNDEEKKDKSKKKKKDDGDNKKKTTKSKSKKKAAADAMVQEAELDPAVCRICQDPEADACTRGSSCEHVFCISCLEDHVSKPMSNPTELDTHLGAPTLGRCPSCHAELKLFEVRDATSGELYYGRYKDIQKTPLAGRVFTPRNKKLQLGNFHFDTDFNKVDSQGRTLPYMDFVDAIELDQEKWMLNDGSQITKRKWFEEGCHFHERTRTFHGTIVFGNPRFQGAYQWDVTLAFNSDYSAINVGVIHKRTERLAEARDDIDKDDAHRYLYPCDGKWKLLWLDQGGNPRTGAVTVRGNEFQQGPYVFHINFTEPMKPGFRWPLDPVYASAKAGINLIDQPLGPDIGEKIEWETTHPAFPEITWVRETVGLPPAPDTTHFGQGTDNHYTSTHSAVESTMYEEYDSSSSHDDEEDDD